MIKITIKPNELEAIALAASTEQTRYYLNGVFFEVYGDNYAMVATDGHRVHSLNVQSKTAPADSFILSAIDIKKALAMVKMGKKEYKQTPLITIERDKGVLDIYIIMEIKDEAPRVLSSFTAKPVDGNFPDFRRVVPAAPESGGNTVAFNANYMADFAEAAKLLNGSKLGCIQTIITDPASPIIINISHQPLFTGVLMPMRF